MTPSPVASPTDAVLALEVAKSVIARTRADPADAVAIGDSVSAFGLDLYRELLAAPDLGLRAGNVVFSPTSIALALGLTRAGALGPTGEEIDAVLHVADQAALEAGLNALDQALASREGSYQDGQGNTQELTLRIANASFAQRGWSIEPAYLDAIASAFGAGVNLVDYEADPEAARRIINEWVGERTAGRIPELLLPPDVTVGTRLYLVNAIYLKAPWLVPFPKDDTALRSFTGLDGEKTTVPTMRLAGGQELPLLRGDGWRATELRYGGADAGIPLAMMLILPDDLESFEAGLGASLLREIGSDLTAERTRLHEAIEFLDGRTGAYCGTYPYSVELSMPRFSIETRAQLKTVLAAMGMPLAFDPARADFAGIHVPESDGEGISIGNVIHQANIDVDEIGTEAAAATAIGMDTAGCSGPEPADEIELRLDHPFLFALRDIETGTILFMGRVVDPGATR